MGLRHEHLMQARGLWEHGVDFLEVGKATGWLRALGGLRCRKGRVGEFYGFGAER